MCALKFRLCAYLKLNLAVSAERIVVNVECVQYRNRAHSVPPGILHKLAPFAVDGPDLRG